MIFNKRGLLLKIFPFIIFVFLTSVILVVWHNNYIYYYEKEKQNFNTTAEVVSRMISKRLQAYVDATHGARGLFLASDGVERSEWKNFIEGTGIFNRNLGISAIAYAEKVTYENKEKFIKEISIDTSTNKFGYSDFKIFPDLKKDDYTVLKYVEPEDKMIKLLGYDLSSENSRNNALTLARDNDETVATEVIKLISSQKSGVSFVLPVFKNGVQHNTLEERKVSLIGFVIVVMQGEDFFNSVLDELSSQGDVLKQKNIFEVYDIAKNGSDEEESLLYVSDTSTTDEYKNNFSTKIDVEIAGRVWRVVVYDGDGSVLTSTEKDLLYTLLPISILVVLLLSSFIYLLIRGRERSLRFAQEITKDLKNKEDKLLSRTKEMEKLNQDLNIQQRAILNILEDVELEKSKMEILTNDLEKFKLAVDNASDQIVITDPEGMVVYANRVVEKITGYKPEEALGKKAGTLWKVPQTQDYYENLWNTIKIEKKVFVGEIQNRRKNGELYMANISISPVLKNTGEVLFYVAIEHDITKEKQIDQAKTEFVSLASHQLRTPLSTINWYAEMLIDGDAGELKPDQKNYLEEIYKGNQRMVELVNSLLNVSRIELGTFAVDPEMKDIKEIALTEINELKLLLEQKNITVTSDFDATLEKMLLDSKLLSIVFQNLLTNAVKYTAEKGKINVTIKKEKSELLISVTDTGYGIPKKDQDRIFTKMFRADNVKVLDTSGTGLGLYIVKSIVEQAIGGKIWFESEENKGTTFYFTVPLSGMVKKEGSKALS